jgi:hypothetical protein
MYDNAATAQNCTGICSVIGSSLVVVNHSSGFNVPDLDAEFVRASASAQLPVNSRQQKAVVARSVNLTRTFKLGFRSRNYQPFICTAIEAEASRIKLEFGVARRLISAVCVFANKSKTGFSSKRSICCVRSGWRGDPSTACNKTS